MRKLLFASLLALVAFAPSLPRDAGACQPYPGSYPHPLDAAYLDDTTPPTLQSASADAWEANHSSGCGGGCGHPALIYVQVDATDDRTAPGTIGYRFAITRGQAPRGFTIASDALRGEVDITGHGELGLRYDDDAPSGWSFDLQITAVDLNGNESTPVTVTIDG